MLGGGLELAHRYALHPWRGTDLHSPSWTENGARSTVLSEKGCRTSEGPFGVTQEINIHRSVDCEAKTFPRIYTEAQTKLRAATQPASQRLPTPFQLPH